ncbi:hypothetical protein Poli38472_007366 [Pythium oligandrum]|uniref:Uncharacterized protein n=1 Tax=Pythium oligandrum TaxID=41045 RepID=A0A8K1FEA8_PYTOL|nr:hypothetical protein Poli38472_007366 [Pythium oligandrum]|eukprot:TMW59221.1 hypothetical protein Poli38472_007366 [Pythium oligandrum]
MGAPKITSDSVMALARWMDLRLEYEGVVSSQCQGNQDEIKKRTVTVRNSFDEGLLDVLCESQWGVEKSSLTEKFLWDWIKEKLKTPRNGELPDIDEMFGGGKLFMDMSERDLEARLTNYFRLCQDILKGYAETERFSSEEGTKMRCKILIDNLPKGLRKKVKAAIPFKKGSSDKIDLLRGVMFKCLEKYEEQQQGKRRRDESSDDDYARKRARTRVSQGKKRKVRVDKHVKTDKQHMKSKFTKGSKDKSRDNSSEGCWECGGNHLKKDCPDLNRTVHATKGDKAKFSAGRQRQSAKD